ncbi:MAG: putative blue pigment (indigoidine) exporter [Oceanicoccus sp.]|jgi:probable blue pigment (indigoidine) exporter
MKTLAWIALTMLAPIIWGSTYIVTSEILPDGAPFTAAVIRCLPVGIVLILFSHHLPVRSQWLKLVVLSALNIGCFQALLFIAAYRLPGGLAAVIGAIQPLIVLGLSWIMLKKSPPKLSLLAGVSAILGMIMLMIAPMLEQGLVWDELGIMAAFLGAMSMGLGTYFSRHWHDQAPSIPLIAFTGWQLALGGFMLVPFAWFFDPVLPQLTTVQLSAYFYLAVVGTLLTYLLWFKGVRQLPPAAVSSLGLLSPISAIVLGWVFLDQRIEGWAMVGLVVVIVSILLVQWSQNAQQRKELIQLKAVK